MLPATPCAAPRYLFPIINTMVALKFQFQNIVVVRCSLGLRRWCSGKEYACQCRRQRFNPWVRRIPWRRKWQPIPVFLPGKSHGQRIPVGYSPWGHKRVGHNQAHMHANQTYQILGDFLRVSSNYKVNSASLLYVTCCCLGKVQ